MPQFQFKLEMLCRCCLHLKPQPCRFQSHLLFFCLAHVDPTLLLLLQLILFFFSQE